MAQYFQLRDDMRTSRRWHLASPVDEAGQEVDPWQFEQGRALELKGRIRFPIYTPGRALDYTMTAFGICVFHGRAVRVFERLGLQEQVQFFPAEVDGTTEPHVILNALRVIRCIDDARCRQVQYYTEEDNEPERMGEYRVVSGLKVDAAKVGDADIFRPWGWPVALLVSERLKQALEQEALSGMDFTPV